MTFTRRKMIGATLISSQSLVRAQDTWPNRTITIVLPYPPGNLTDAIARMTANKLSQKWKVPVIVDNRAGANGVIGTQLVSRAEADGYTILLSSTGHFSNSQLMGKLPYDPERDFRGVAKVITSMVALLVAKNSRFNSVGELIAFARANPGKLSYASSGNGSSHHLAAAYFANRAGISLLHVPYKNMNQPVIDTASGQVDLTFAAGSHAVPQVQAGNVKALAVTGLQRMTVLPNVPTLDESGLKGFDFSSFVAFFARSSMPDAIVRRYSAALQEIVGSTEFQDLVRPAGVEIDFADHAKWNASLAEENARWVKYVKVSGAKLD